MTKKLAIISFLIIISFQAISQNYLEGAKTKRRGNPISAIVDWMETATFYENASIFLKLESQVKSDFVNYQPCLTIFLDITYDRSVKKIKSIFIYDAPISKEYTIADTRVKYFTHPFNGAIRNDSGYTLSKSGLVDVFPENNCIENEGEVKSIEYRTQESEIRFSKAKRALQKRVIEDLGIYGKIDGIFENDSKEEKGFWKDMEAQISSHNQNIKELRRKSDEKRQLVKNQKNRLNQLRQKTKRNNQRITHFREEIKSKDSKIKDKKNEMTELQEKLNGPCIYGGSCTCPEIHGTDCHATGYYCETHPRKVPCEDDYRCVLRNQIEKVEKEIGILENEKETKINKKEDLSVFIENNEETKLEVQSDIDFYVNEINKLDEEVKSERKELKKLQEKKERAAVRIEKMDNELNEVKAIQEDFINYLETLLVLESSIYLACLDSENEANPFLDAKMPIEEYLSFYNSLKDIEYLPAILNELNYPKSHTDFKK